MDVTDLRSTERFRVAQPLSGSFGLATVAVVDVSAGGAQIEHTQPLRLGSRARLLLKRGEVAVAVPAQTVWSHLSKTPNSEGKYVYRSGVRLEQATQEYVAAMQLLFEQGAITADPESLERKKKKELEKASRPVVKYLRPDVEITSDQRLLIEHARKQLLSNPDEAQRWYQRAKYAITHGTASLAGDDIHNREDVLAVWEYLERSVDVSIIAIVFERMRMSH